MQIDAGSELDDLQTQQHQPIVFLNNLVHVVFPDSMVEQRTAYDQFQQECTVLNTTAYTAIFDLDGNRGKADAAPMADLGLSHQPARLRQGRLHTRTVGVIHS